MHNKNRVFNGSAKLYDQILDGSKRYTNQIGRSKYQFYFTPSFKVDGRAPGQGVQDLIDYIVDKSGKKKTPKTFPVFVQHIELIILNLAKCVMLRQWCIIPMDTNAYSNGQYKNKGLSARYIRLIVDVMEKEGFIEVVRGKKYKVEPTRTAIQPLSVMAIDALEHYLHSSEAFESPYASLAKPVEGYTLTDSDEAQLKQDEQDMAIINGFLSNHYWPCKSPVKRKYSGKIGLSGRIYCSFQSLSQRRTPVRANSMIDEEPIVEVDVKASHMRMAVALFYGQKLSREFYSEVEEQTGVYQSKVKKFSTYLFSCSSRESALGSFKSSASGGEKDFEAIESYILGRFPNLPAYKGWSLLAMNYEGEILKRVMLEGVRNGVVTLPIHDAVAVKETDKDWAERVLVKHWNKVIGVEACEVG